MHAATINFQLELCARVLERNLGDVSHEESLVAAKGYNQEAERGPR